MFVFGLASDVWRRLFAWRLEVFMNVSVRRPRAVLGSVLVGGLVATAGMALSALPAAGADPAVTCVVSDHVDGTVWAWCDPSDVVVIEYQWVRDGVAIPGADQYTYTYSASDVGHIFTATLQVSQNGQVSTVRTGYMADGYQSGRAAGVYDWACAISPWSLSGVGLDDTLTVTPNVSLPIAGVDSAIRWHLSYIVPGSVDTDRLPAFWDSLVQDDTVAFSDLMSIGSLLKNSRSDQGTFFVEARITLSVNGVRDVIACPDLDNIVAGIPDLAPFADADPAFPVASHVEGDTGVTGTLEADTTGWPAGTTFTYQWTRDGEKIAGATSASYTLTADDSGKDVGVVVWGTIDGITAWQWGEVTAGTITTSTVPGSPGPSQTATPPGTTPADQATPSGSGTVTSTTRSPLAATGSSALLPVLLVAGALILAGAAVVLVVRRVRSTS
jgi:hypothetical protein